MEELTCVAMGLWFLAVLCYLTAEKCAAWEYRRCYRKNDRRWRELDKLILRTAGYPEHLIRLMTAPGFKGTGFRGSWNHLKGRTA